MASIINLLNDIGITCNRFEMIDLDQASASEYEEVEPPVETPFEDPRPTAERCSVGREFGPSTPPLFRYFIDGSRKTYRVADMEHGGRYFPMVAAQIGVATCERDIPAYGSCGMKPISKETEVINALVLPTLVGASDLEEIRKAVAARSRVPFEILTYETQGKTDKSPLDLAVAAAMGRMHDMEVAAACNLARAGMLANDSMLVIDGSLMFRNQKFDIQDFRNMKDTDVVIGKDILELLSSAMYVDPLTVYREYVQNAADALRDAAAQGLPPDPIAHQIRIAIDQGTRTMKIRDTGTGIPAQVFASRMTAVGASSKRGTNARGFRGVGRLAGLGYCRELIFRSRTARTEPAMEIRWDCAKLKGALRSADYTGGLAQLVTDIVRFDEIRELPDQPDRFFEVEMVGVVRHRNDSLLDEIAVSEYLSQVAPVPFATDFSFGRSIGDFLSRHIDPGNVEIRINDGEPLVRPYRNTFEAGDGKQDAFTDVECVEIPGTDGGIAAVGWLLHHGYRGAIPNRALVKGLRFRTGNIQVGEHSIAEDLFPEPRFNSWTVGEMHVTDRRILPNGRRDHYEESVHLGNLMNHLTPIGRDITKRCRGSSIRRKWLREFELHGTVAREKLNILAQGTLGDAARKDMVSEVDRAIAPMARIAAMDDLAPEAQTTLRPKVHELREELDRLAARKPVESPLARLPAEKRAMYEHLFELVYECSTNRVAAKALIDRIMTKLL